MPDFLEYIEVPFTADEGRVYPEEAEDRYPESLVRAFVNEFTKPGDKVFDPFLGFGTTAFVAEDMGRIPYGIEADGERYEWAAAQLEHWMNILHADSVDIGSFKLPRMDFCMTSPPYMPAHHKWNPLYGGDPAYAGYDTYLARMAENFCRAFQHHEARRAGRCAM
ncbi:MAG: site-specific DNA-methyltransferase [Alphaproteobacteria bacterium]|nr:site-specific DNA-methyltransferase [Alphaproteobacteria bacterium]